MDKKLLEEERQLEAEREEEERKAEEKEAASKRTGKATTAAPKPADGMDQLSMLLKKTSAYTDFLYQQLTIKEKEKELEVGMTRIE